MKKTLRERMTWRAVYAVCVLMYLVWIGFLSRGEINMVNTRYSRAKERLVPAQVEKTAREELVAECRQEQDRSGREAVAMTAEADPCFSPAPAAVEERGAKVLARLSGDKAKAGRKLILFYVTFVVVFLALPVIVTYYLLAFIIWMAWGAKSANKGKKA